MNFTLIDAGGFLLAVVACGIIVAVPGWGLARLFGFARMPGTPVDPLMGVVVGLAVLPLVDSLATRFLGLDTALALTLVGALVSIVLAWRAGVLRRPTGFVAAILLVWLVLMAIEWVDVDVASRLFQPLTVFDAVKHAATTQAIVDSGAPPRDAFFLRSQAASYYYFFYTLAALAVRLCGGLVDAKAAVGGVAFWVGVGIYGLVRLAIARAGLEVAGSATRLPKIVVAILAASSVDIVVIVFLAWRFGYWYPDPVQWNEQVTSWLESLFWVPHHLSALIAGIVGLAALAGCVAPEGARREPMMRAVLLAALCFASSLGLSVWVTLPLVTTALVWGAILLVERRWRVLAALIVAGVLSIVFAAPQLVDLHTGRSNAGGIPIALTVRWFLPLETLVPDQPWNTIARLLILPFNYLIAFGAIGVGSILFWNKRYWRDAGDAEFARVMTIAALVGLVLGAFLRSTLFNNDLGWRVTEYSVLAATVWTATVLDRHFAAAAAARRWTFGAVVLAAIFAVGYVTSGYMLFAMRAYEVLPLKASLRYLSSGGETERALRVAYQWANRNLPAHTVLQHDPTRRRAFAFGLYSRHQVAVSDDFGSLYGADPDAVTARIQALGPIFETVLPTAVVRAKAVANGIDDLVVTAEDPVWSQPTSFVWTAKPLYATDRVLIIPVAALKD